MNTIKNHVCITARLGGDVEFKKLDSGNLLAKVNVAVNETYKDKSGQWVENTHWHSLTGWGAVADTMHRKLKKGTLAVFHGKLVSKSYNAADGSKKIYNTIEIADFIVVNNQ